MLQKLRLSEMRTRNVQPRRLRRIAMVNIPAETGCESVHLFVAAFDTGGKSHGGIAAG